MSGGVLLARVSLNEKLLAVTDHRGVIVLVSEDACWALGVPGPAASFVGSSLLDHLTPEDQIEYRNAMRRRSGSLLRLRHQGCFVWLDISHHPRATPRLKRALHRVERARSACSCCAKPQRPALYHHNHGHARADNEFHKQHGGQQQQQQGDDSIALHVLTKERPLDWFLEPAAGEGAEEGEDEGSLAAAAADSLECLSLHTSESSSSSSSSGASTRSHEELLAACWDDNENFVTPPQELYETEPQTQQQATAASGASTAHMYKEYSFRDIFEYAMGGGGRAGGQGSRASNLNLASFESAGAAACGGKGSSSSSSHKMSMSSTAAAARAVAAVVLKAGQAKRNKPAAAAASDRSAGGMGAVAAKCRAAPESSPASYTHTYSTSWRSVGGYMAQRAAATVAGLSGASAGSSSHSHGHGHGHHQGGGGGDDGWGLYVDLDIVG